MLTGRPPRSGPVRWPIRWPHHRRGWRGRLGLAVGAAFVAQLVMAAAATAVPVPPAPATAALCRLLELGFGPEYGPPAPVVHKWSGTVRIGLAGGATALDAAELDRLVTELDGLVAPVHVVRDDASPSLRLWVVAPASFPAIIPTYQPENPAFFWVHWDATGTILDGRIVVDGTAAWPRRRHLIDHEVTQSLGLMLDSSLEPGSVFDGRSASLDLTALDRATIRLLYDQRVRPGANAKQVLVALDMASPPPLVPAS